MEDQNKTLVSNNKALTTDIKNIKDQATAQVHHNTTSVVNNNLTAENVSEEFLQRQSKTDNLVLFGVPEHKGDEEDQQRHDFEQLRGVCMAIKVGASRKVVSITRKGKHHGEAKSRIMVVKFHEMDYSKRTAILMNAKNLWQLERRS